MKPIYEFQTIQVELTNACIHRCSNCTRFCGHHKKPFFMEWDIFKKAIDTLVDWPRCIGIMGGEPTLHPQFERFVRYANEKHPAFYQIGGGHKPIPSLSKYMIDANGIKTGPLNKFRGLGLWSSVCDKYYEHYELIQDVFSYQCINDHTASSRHQAWLMTRKEFGIGDDEWVKLRDNCWWQRLLGSPSITPKGAFFCEVAAAMDMLFDGPGGWKIEKDWWKRDPDDFKDQLQWCEFCSGAFLSFDRDANESIDDVSPYMYEKLKQVGSPKLEKSGTVQVHNVSDIPIKPRKNLLLYQPDNELRFTEKNTSLFPKKIDAIVFVEQENDISIVKKNREWFDKFYIVAASQSIAQKVQDTTFQVILSEKKNHTRILANIIRKAEDWVAIIDPAQLIPAEQGAIWRKTIFNPGTMHLFEDFRMIMFHVKAKALRSHGFDEVATLDDVASLPKLWVDEKVVVLHKGYEQDISPDIEEWIENITKAGIMNWNYLRDVMDDMVLRRKVMPQIDTICRSKYSLAEKLKQMDAIIIGKGSPSAICNKVKTAIHNELGCAFANISEQEIYEHLLSNANSFCVQYALAMLSIGDAKEKHLMNCILHPCNTYYLGVSALKYHYDAYYQNDPEYDPQVVGILPEILSYAKNANKLVVVGNHYSGKSVEMILAAAGHKPCCFMDEERQGFGYDGLETLSVKDALAKYENYVFLWTEQGDYANYQKRLMERQGAKQFFHSLHPLSIKEMSMTPACCDINVDITLLDKVKKEMPLEKQKQLLQNIMLEKTEL